ncbi:MAG: ThiF family adenylyltransferase, partial [Clostridia bacterium]|nr:ThiF family adenylyltransferase [Clostridia bacterium]
MSKKDIQGFDISAYSAAVIGCGGLGCNVAVHLAGSGIGRLYLCDYDTVSESNLNRQFLYTKDDTGFFKTQRAAEKLSKYSPDTEIIAVNKKITEPDDLAFAGKCDIIFIAADNNALRRTVTDFCYLHNVPFVNGGINGFYGTVYLCVPGKTPCTECAGLLAAQEKSILSVSST